MYSFEFTSLCYIVWYMFKYTDFKPPPQSYLYSFSELPPPVTLYMNNYTDLRTSFSFHNQLQINNLQDFLQVFVCAAFFLHVVVRVRVDNLISEGS